MPSTVIEYLDGTKKEYDFFRGGEYMAHYKAEELLQDEGHLARCIYTVGYYGDYEEYKRCGI